MKNRVFSVERKIADAFFDLGLSYERNNRYDLAKENYRKALDYDSEFIMAKKNLDILIENEESKNR